MWAASCCWGGCCGTEKTTRNEIGDSNYQVSASSSSRPSTKTGEKRETEQSSSTPKSTTIGAQNGDIVPPPPAPHPEQINRRKRQKTTPQTLPDAVVPSTKEVDQSTAMAGFYKLACMSPEQSPDPRCKVEVWLCVHWRRNFARIQRSLLIRQTWKGLSLWL